MRFACSVGVTRIKQSITNNVSSLIIDSIWFIVLLLQSFKLSFNESLSFNIKVTYLLEKKSVGQESLQVLGWS